MPELTADLTLYCANSVLMRPDLSEDGHLIGGKGLKCIVNGVKGGATYGRADDTQGVQMHFQSLPPAPGPSLPIQERRSGRSRSLSPSVSSVAAAAPVPSGRYGRDRRGWGGENDEKIKM